MCFVYMSVVCMCCVCVCVVCVYVVCCVCVSNLQKIPFLCGQKHMDMYIHTLLLRT